MNTYYIAFELYQKEADGATMRVWKVFDTDACLENPHHLVRFINQLEAQYPGTTAILLFWKKLDAPRIELNS